MTCQEALALLYDVIDNEATSVDLNQVKEHLSHCKNCSDVYRVEQAVDRLMKAKLQGDTPTVEIAQLKSSVLSALDAIDSGHSCSMEKKSPDPTFLTSAAGSNPDHPVRETAYVPEKQGIFRLGRVIAIAASIVVILGATYVGSILLDHRTHYIPLEAIHLEAQQEVNQLADITGAQNLQARVSLDYGYDVFPSVGEFELVAARYDKVDDVDVAHFLYRNGNRVVSVFVAHDGEIEIPEELRDHPVVRDHVEFYDHNCRGCRLVYHTVGDLVVVTATKERDIDLLAFVPGRKVA